MPGLHWAHFDGPPKVGDKAKSRRNILHSVEIQEVVLGKKDNSSEMKKIDFLL